MRIQGENRKKVCHNSCEQYYNVPYFKESKKDINCYLKENYESFVSIKNFSYTIMVK